VVREDAPGVTVRGLLLVVHRVW